MNEALQRLVGQASGDLSAGLRPRLPSRFESGIRETGFQETQAEQSPRPTPTPAPSTESDEGSPRPAPASSTESETASLSHTRRITPPAPAPLPTRDSEGRLDGPHPITHKRTTTGDASPGISTASPVPTPLLPEALSLRTPLAPLQEPSGHRPQIAGHRVDLEHPRQEHRDPPHSAPEPLLPPDPAASLTGNLAVADTVPPLDAIDGPSAPDEAAPPEISIHIGRLDIRSEAPKPAPQKRSATPARSLPSLSDYLRGRRS
jgi:hypothetical protein